MCKSDTIRIVVILITVLLFNSCYKKNIQFGNVSDSYTDIVFIDTVEAKLTTVLLDSFPTNGQNTFLLGRYYDPYLGKLSAKPFFQLRPPADLDLLPSSVYDSLVLIIPMNKYFYGDTSRQQTIEVKELLTSLNYTYGNSIYNTSLFAEKSTLGSRTLFIHPNKMDSITIRLNDSKGLELFGKIMQRSDTIANSEYFLTYLRGLSIQFHNSDSTSIYGVLANADLKMRLYYHATLPHLTTGYKDFTLVENNLRFTNLTADRTNLSLPNSSNQIQEIASEITGNLAFTQPSIGVLCKVTFPSIRDLLHLKKEVRLLKAVFLLKVADNTYNNNFKLPSKLYLAATDARNYIGDFVAEANLQIITQPENNAFYPFEITLPVKELLTNAGRSEYGFYILENKPGSTATINRSIFGNSMHNSSHSLLQLTILTTKD